MHWVRLCVLFLLLIGGLRGPPWECDHTDTPFTSTGTLGGGRPSVKKDGGKGKPRAQTPELWVWAGKTGFRGQCLGHNARGILGRAGFDNW